MMCDLSDICSAFNEGELINCLSKIKENAVRKRFIAIVRSSGNIALRKRANGIWAGLYEPPRLQAAPKTVRIGPLPLCIN